MESVPSRKNSRGSRSRSGSEKSGSRRSSAVKKSKKQPEDLNIDADAEIKVVNDEEAEDFEEAGFVLEETDSEDSDSDDKDVRKDVEDPQQDEGLVNEKNPIVADTETADEDAAYTKDMDPSAIEDDANDNSKEAKTTEEEKDEEEETQDSNKKRSRKLKKKSEKRIGFDGREVVFVTEFTQTDWRWKDKAELTGKAKIVASTSDVDTVSGRSESIGVKSILVKPDSREAISRTQTEFESTIDDRTTTDVTPFSLQPNDEFGIPLLDMSSDSDSSDDDMPKKVKSHRHHLPTIGPPQILKYVRESERMDRETDRTSSEFDDRLLDSTDYPSTGPSPGMFGGMCEFCGKDIKPFPTLEQQLSLPPESLHCCDEYREFVEFAMTTANRLEEDLAKKNQKIDVKVHAHHGSKQARKMAKEQAVQRMRERELQRRQQEASGLQAAYFNSKHSQHSDNESSSKGEASSRKPKRKPQKDRRGSAREGGSVVEKKEERDSWVVDREKTKPSEYAVSTSSRAGSASGGAGSIGGSVGGEVGVGGRGGVGEGEGVPVKERGRERGRGGGAGENVSAYVPGSAYSQGQLYGAFPGMAPEVARQMKTINYQLSSQRCLEEGWTLRAPSPLDLDDMDAEVFIPEPLHPAMIASGKLHDRQLIEKFYPDGSKFLTIFPDGTGNIFYPSGNLAIVILSVSLGQYTYVVQDDCHESEILGVFEPTGFGCCYFANGKVRLNYDQMGGLELDFNGGRKRIWSWRDQETHVHAPPFQPIVFGMNRFIGIRFMAQESIALTLTGRKRSCRFNVGAKLKLVAPENLQPKMIDENQLYIDERKVRVDHILNKVSTLLKFPKSPKVDRILPPLAVRSRQQKVDKLKEEYVSSMQIQAAGKKSKKRVKSSRLSPIPVISVN